MIITMTNFIITKILFINTETFDKQPTQSEGLLSETPSGYKQGRGCWLHQRQCRVPVSTLGALTSQGNTQVTVCAENLRDVQDASPAVTLSQQNLHVKILFQAQRSVLCLWFVVHCGQNYISQEVFSHKVSSWPPTYWLRCCAFSLIKSGRFQPVCHSDP